MDVAAPKTCFLRPGSRRICAVSNSIELSAAEMRLSIQTPVALVLNLIQN